MGAELKLSGSKSKQTKTTKPGGTRLHEETLTKCQTGISKRHYKTFYRYVK